MSFSSLSLRALLGILAIAITITSVTIQPISVNVYAFSITAKNNLPISLTITHVELWALVNSQLAVYGVLIEPIIIEPNTSAVITGTVTFYIPISELRRMPQETPVQIKADINYSIWGIIPQEKKPEATVTLGQITSQFS